MKRLEEELQKIEDVLEEWHFVRIERKMTFIRTDGLPMLYLRARTKSHYLHIEGIVREDKFGFYCKLTKSNRNKHSHRDEIIGWDNLYNDKPHIHFDEDKERDYRDEEIIWEEIENMIREMEAKQ